MVLLGRLPVAALLVALLAAAAAPAAIALAVGVQCDGGPGAAANCTGGAHGDGRVVAVGDLHGDLTRTLQTLRAAGIVDGRGAWVGGTTTLVQTGDVMDRGPDTKALLELMYRLREEASASGGRVVLLNGNHEAACLLGWEGMVHLDEYVAFGGRPARTAALSAEGEIGQWLRALPAVAVVGDTVFAHAGLLPDAARLLGVEGANSALRRVLLPESHGLGAWEDDPAVPWCDGDGAAVVAATPPASSSVVAANSTTTAAESDRGRPCLTERRAKRLVNGDSGPLWTRAFAQHDEAAACALAAASLAEITAARAARGEPPVSRMVVGHTPQRDGAPSLRCGGALVLNDVGLSRWISDGGAVAATEIVGGDVRRIVGVAD